MWRTPAACQLRADRSHLDPHSEDPHKTSIFRSLRHPVEELIEYDAHEDRIDGHSIRVVMRVSDR